MKRGGFLRRRAALAQRGARALRQAKAEACFRRAVLCRAGGACERCGRRDQKLQAHHLLPRSRGGKHEAKNGAALCRPCHSAVHDHLAEDWRKWVRSA